TQMARRKIKRKLRQTVYYVVEIENWDWSYSFGLDTTRRREEPYMEFRHLEIKGKLLRPQNIKAEAVELTLLPDFHLKQENRSQNEPHAVGSISVSGGMGYILLSMPVDTLDPILQMLIAGKTRYVIMRGAPLRYREALIEHYSLNTTLDDEDLPTEE